MIVTGFIAALLFAVVAILATDLALAPWIAAQLVKALWPWTSTFATKAEAWAWARWDEERRGFRIAPDRVEELAVGTAAPSLTRPWIIRGILNASGSTPQSKALRDYNWLLDSPVGDIEVDYFSNASAEDGIVPDARAPLRTIVNGIIAGGNAKIGTEMIFRSFPQVIASDCLLMTLAHRDDLALVLTGDCQSSRSATRPACKCSSRRPRPSPPSCPHSCSTSSRSDLAWARCWAASRSSRYDEPKLLDATPLFSIDLH